MPPLPFRAAPRAIFAVILAIATAALALAACGSSGSTYTAPSTSAKCAVTTTASPSTLPPGGGTGSITVETARECQWSATADGAWIKLTAGTSGQGPGTISFTASPNADPAPRAAAVVVNDQRLELNQGAAACTMSLSDPSTSLSSEGGTGHVDVRASNALCAWTAASNADWITITSGAHGTGPGTVTFSVAPSGGARSATLTIAGQAFTVNQSAVACSYTVAPATFAVGSGGGSTTVTLGAGADCAWQASSDAGWIVVSPASGSGSGTLTVTVAPASGPARTGTATIAGQTLTVTQADGCSAALSPASAAIAASGGAATVAVAAAAGCGWSAVSNAGWISVTSGASGSGPGTVQLAVAANSGGARAGTVTIAGQTFTVNQAAAAVTCTYSLAPSSQTVGAPGGAGTFTVTAQSGCAWNATTAAGWVSVSPASGQGTAALQFTTAANSGPARTGTIVIGGQTFTISQDGGCTATVSPATITAPAAPSAQNVQVATGGGCAWSAASNVSWIAVLSGGGSGSGTVQLGIAANVGAARSGTATIAGQTVTVTQDAAVASCSVTLKPTSQDMPKDGGKGKVSVDAPDGCAWTARSTVSWISLTGPTSGSGRGEVKFDVDKNDKHGDARSGTIVIGDAVFTVTQKKA